MKPEEAIERLHQFLQQSIGIIEDADRGDDYAVKVKEDAEKDLSAIQLAIEALKEVQQYREIGTVEECKEMAVIANKKTNPDELAKIIVEWIQYNKIGTVEECREAVEKQKPKKPDYEGDGYDDKGELVYDTWICPNCDKKYEVDYEDYKHCPNCGQAIAENLEGMEDE